MILVPRKYFIFLIIITTAAFTVIGLYGYSIKGLGNVLTPADRKYFAETILFMTIASAVLCVGTIFMLYRRSRRIIRELDKLIDLNRFKQYSPQESLRKMGVLGERINLLYAQMNDLNERKSVKISAQSGVIEFLLQNIGLPLIVLDVTGRATEASRKYLEAASISAEDLRTVPIEKIVSESEVSGSARSHAEDSRNPRIRLRENPYHLHARLQPEQRNREHRLRLRTGTDF